MLNLDTNILIHALAGKLTPAERRLPAADCWSISAIVLWEIARRAQVQRISLDIDSPDPQVQARAPGRGLTGTEYSVAGF